jgi:uncharacterized membrane protein
MDPGIGLLMMLICGVGGVLLLGVLVVIAFRLLGPRSGDGLGRARSLLHRRLASGEIDLEEYYERESALRHAQPLPKRRRGRHLG